MEDQAVGPPIARSRDDTNPMRRPSDLPRISARGPRGEATVARGDVLSWPQGFVAEADDRDSLHVLLGLASMTPRRLLELAQDHPTARGCLDAIARGVSGSPADQTAARESVPAHAVERARAADARLVAVGDREYPQALLHLFDPPAGLFVVGHPLDRATQRVAIVGARNCSPSGREMSETLGQQAARAGVTVVSGGARGIDAAAHYGAFGGASTRATPTIAVLGCGVDVPYPKANRALLARIAGEGSLVSEYPPGTPAEPFRFPARNRIVAGLSRAVVVVEGTSASGSLTTAEFALELGRDVFAVPGPPYSELASAPLELIREGATLIRGPEDLLADLGLGHPTIDPTGAEAIPTGLSVSELSVWKALASPSPVDLVQRTAGLPLTEVLAALAGLELRGLAVGSGGRYRRP